MVYNRIQKRDQWGRKRYLRRPESEWIRVEVPALRIVSDEAWARAHARFAASRAAYVKATGGLLFGRPVNSVSSPYLLTGLAECVARHGSMIVLSRDFKRERRPYYGCAYYHHRGTSVCRNSLEVEMGATDGAVPSAVER